MKRTLTLLGLVASTALAQAGSAAGAPVLAASPSLSSSLAEWAMAAPGAASSVRQYQLANGMQLIVQPDKRAPTAVNMVWVRVGSMDEVDGTSGIAHVVEHMMFKGSAKVAPGDFSRKVAALGGRENAFTNRDYTGYYQQIPANKLREVMALEADRFASNQWPDAEFTKEIEVVKEERRMRTEDNPRSMLMEQLMATVFQASPYHRPVVGWMDDLHAMTADDVRQFQKAWYQPANAVIVIAGDVDPEQVKVWAEESYGQIPARAVPVRKPRPEPAQIGVRRIEVKQPAEQAFVAMAYRVPAFQNLAQPGEQDRDALALTVLSAVLDGYDGARLERALVQGKGRVADGAGSSASVFGRGPALFMLSGVPAKGHTAAEVEKALRGQIQRIAKEGVQASELERVKTQWMASNVYERDSVFSQAQTLGSYWIMGMPVDAEDQVLRQLMAVTAEQVQSVARRYFGDDQLTVGVLVPQPLAGKKPRPASAAAAGGDLH
ncbi:M16 family metallopeptidase [Comamonas sp. GB3 AK4-5]|uniref:M16 family metallopeptidase n=1 Tax=Comamonas sp. GB3 AK4-5 TaxID=3231487 RepID=UPI00351F3980